MTRSLLPALVLPALLGACAPPTPALNSLATPVLSVQRRAGGPLLVVLTYDEKRTPCGEVPGLRATLDGNPLGGSAGRRVVDEMTGVVSCEMPNWAVNPGESFDAREVVLTDDVTTLKLGVDTLAVGAANAMSPPATLRPGYVLRWSASLPPKGITSWTVGFTPTGGALQSWGQGGSSPDAFATTVPAVTQGASGSVSATWLVNAAVTACDGVTACEAVIQGGASFPAVVSP